jgi:hypothetical protein
MAVFETQNPLPAGRYWIDVIGADKIRAFFTLLNTAAIAAPGLVLLENVELNGDSVDLQSFLRWALGDTTRAWFLFRVGDRTKGAFSIDHKTFGYPSHASDNVKTETDTAQTPPDPVDEASDQVGKIITVVELVLGLYTLKTLLEFVSKAKKL